MPQRHTSHLPPRVGESGQTLAEYATVLSVITLAILLTIIAIGDAAGGIIQGVADIIPS